MDEFTRQQQIVETSEYEKQSQLNLNSNAFALLCLQKPNRLNQQLQRKNNNNNNTTFETFGEEANFAQFRPKR